jgi:hypothetical protein
MYIVYQQGVYRHAILGVFTTIELAKKSALLGALDEYDGYHDFVIAKVSVDEMHSGDVVEDLFSVSSQDHVRERNQKKYDPRPLSRKICLYNNEGNITEVLLEMTRDVEVIRT